MARRPAKIWTGTDWDDIGDASKVLKTGDTITGPTVVDVNSSSTALRITQVGSGNALVVEDSTSPDATPFVVNASGNVGIGTSSPASTLEVNGVASFSDGSATSPSITNTGDLNTGILFPDADTVAITTGGTERMRINSGGVVGINMTVPAAVLHVTGIDSLMLERNNDAATATNASFRKSRGTQSSPTVVQQNDNMGNLNWRAYDGANYTQSASIRCEVDGTVSTGVVPGRFMVVPCNASGVQTERLRVDKDGLITGTGTSLGAWTAYTPTLGGTGWAIGNATVNAYYCQIGKIVHVRIFIQFGSTSTYGAGDLTLTTPLSASTTGTNRPTFSCFMFDTSLTALYGGVGVVATTFQPKTLGASGLTAGITTNAPMTWATGDQLYFTATYEAT